MFKLGSVKIVLLFGFLFILSILPLCTSTKNQFNVKNKYDELFIPELIRLNSVQKLSYYIDSVYHDLSSSTSLDTALFVKVSSDVIKKRFYHGVSNYSINDNWIAFLSSKLVWEHLSAIVKPDDILKHEEGLCSQQTIVFLEILNQKGVNFRTVGLGYKEGPGHFLGEVKYNGTWHLHDVTVEPKWEKVVNHHKSLEYYLQHKDSLYLAYEGRLDRKIFDKIMQKVEFGNKNQFPAKKMLFFHQITLLFVYLIPIFLFLLFIISLMKNKKVVSKT